MSVTHHFVVGMTCGGCSNAVTKILTKLDGVDNVLCNVDKKQVLVTGTAEAAVMTAKLQKWGAAAKKEVAYVGVWTGGAAAATVAAAATEESIGAW